MNLSSFFTLLAFSTIFTVSSLSSFAALPPAKGPRYLIGEGTIIGGQAGGIFSIRNFELMNVAELKAERLVVELGNAKGLPVKGMPTYYHVDLEKNPQRIIIDFSQTASTSISEEQIRKALAKSQFIKSAELTHDPSDNSMDLILYPKQNVKLRVMQVIGEKTSAKVVMEMVKL